MGVRIEGHVMVHRTDIAGGNTGQTSPGYDRMCRRAISRRAMCRRARNGVFLENNFSLKRQDGLPTAVPPAHAIYLELLTL
jgi:hypothetical protein